MTKLGAFILGFIPGFAIGVLVTKYYLDNINEVEYYEPEINPRPSEPPVQNDEHPKDSDEDETYEEKLANLNYHENFIEKEKQEERHTENFNMTMNYYRNQTRDPEILTFDEVQDLPPTVTSIGLYYYTYSMVLSEVENDELVQNPEQLIGDCLEKSGFGDNDDKTLFVMNYRMNVLYEISKVKGEYGPL